MTQEQQDFFRQAKLILERLGYMVTDLYSGIDMQEQLARTHNMRTEKPAVILKDIGAVLDKAQATLNTITTTYEREVAYQEHIAKEKPESTKLN